MRGVRGGGRRQEAFDSDGWRLSTRMTEACRSTRMAGGCRLGCLQSVDSDGWPLMPSMRALRDGPTGHGRSPRPAEWGAGVRAMPRPGVPAPAYPGGPARRRPGTRSCLWQRDIYDAQPCGRHDGLSGWSIEVIGGLSKGSATTS